MPCYWKVCVPVQTKRRHQILVAIFTTALIAYVLMPDEFAATIKARLTGQFTVTDRVTEFTESVKSRLYPAFNEAGVTYPPQHICLVAYKAEKRLDLFAANKEGTLKFIKHYVILGASGTIGPKLHEGDGQVPEGIYQIDGLNPNSQYHLSLHVNYPNEFDREMAARDRRDQLGHSIFIHGGRSSIGCLAMGDEAAEELFVLVAQTSGQNALLIITPSEDIPAARERVDSPPDWINELDRQIIETLSELPK